MMKQLDIPLKKDPGQGLAINLLVKADLTHLIKTPHGKSSLGLHARNRVSFVGLEYVV